MSSAAQLQSPTWSENSPQLDRRQLGAGSFLGHSKHTYRQVPPHPQQLSTQSHYYPMVPSGIPFSHMAPPIPRSPFYPMGVPGLSYGPGYGPGSGQDFSYCYYPHPPWPMHGGAYPPPGYLNAPPGYANRPGFANQHLGFANSPPLTPPLPPPRPELSYVYPVGHGGAVHAGGARVPQTPSINRWVDTQTAPANKDPQPKQPRASWSSPTVSEGPDSPLEAPGREEPKPKPLIVNQAHHVSQDRISSSGNPITPMVSGHVGQGAAAIGQQDHMKAPGNGNLHSQEVARLQQKAVEELLSSGPPIPLPVPALLPSELARATIFALENPTFTTNVYIRGLPPGTDDAKLLAITSRFGKVISHKAITDVQDRMCKGYGFARYEKIEDARNCIRGLISLNYEAGFARESFNARLKSLSDPGSTNLYVSNIPLCMTEKDMQYIFIPYYVVSTRLLRGPDGASRGVGFARFKDRPTCDQIIREFHGRVLNGEAAPLQIRYADTRAQKCLKNAAIKAREGDSEEYINLRNVYYCSPYPPPPPGIPAPTPPPAPYTHGSWFNNRHNHSSSACPGIPATLSSVANSTFHSTNPEAKEGMSGETSSSVPPENVQDHGNDATSECDSDTTSVPSTIRSAGCSGFTTRTPPTGSFSDPGDGYRGSEVSSEN